jgi:hypothetical protein
MSFSAFSSFLQNLVFQCSKNQLKNLPFVSTFGFSAFQLKKSAEKQKQASLRHGDASEAHEWCNFSPMSQYGLLMYIYQ